MMNSLDPDCNTLNGPSKDRAKGDRWLSKISKLLRSSVRMGERFLTVQGCRCWHEALLSCSSGSNVFGAFEIECVAMKSLGFFLKK